MSPPSKTEEYLQTPKPNSLAQSQNKECEINLTEKPSSLSGNKQFFENVEDEIPFYTIKQKESGSSQCLRNEKAGNKRKGKSSNFRENIPILIRNISHIDFDKSKFGGLKTFLGTNFRTVMIYGRCCFLGFRSKSQYHLYSVDDGTGSIIVHFNKHVRKDYLNDVSQLNHLENELRLFKIHSLPLLLDDFHSEGCDILKTMSGNIDTIYNIVKRNILLPETPFPLGCKVNVIGIPFYLAGGRPRNEKKQNRIRLYAIEMYEDSKPNRDKEIFFKRSMLKFYYNNIEFLKNYIK